MKRLLIIIAFFLGVSSLQAQERTFWHKINYFLTKPAVVDTTRIYQPKPCFSLGLFSTGQKAVFNTNVKFNIDIDGQSVPGLSTYRLSENLCKKVGLEVGYGNISLGKRAHSRSISSANRGVYGSTISKSPILSPRS